MLIQKISSLHTLLGSDSFLEEEFQNTVQCVDL